MGRLITSVVSGLAGAAAGMAVHQYRNRDPEAGGVEITIAAPPGSAAAGALAGLVLGSPLAGFVTGFGIAAAMGTEFDRFAEARLRTLLEGRD